MKTSSNDSERKATGRRRRQARAIATVFMAVFAAVLLIFAHPICHADLSLPALTGSSPVFGQAPFHIDSQPWTRIKATLVDRFDLPGVDAREWTIYAPDPPDTDDQTDAAATLDIVGRRCTVASWSELSPLSRTLLQTEFYDRSGSGSSGASLATRATFTATLYRRFLVAGAPAEPVAPLGAADRALYTRTSRTIDYQSAAFQTWLDSHRLRRLAGERDLDFALRVFEYIRNNYTYTYDLSQHRRASAICRVDATDCGGLSQLFVAAMRASGVPATVLCGRIATSTDDRADHGNCHVKAQFWAHGIGWVPVEMSGATCDRTAPYWVYFGRTYGDFLTLSVDNDQELFADHIGIEDQRGLQGIRFFVWGTRDSSAPITDASDWTVKHQPLVGAYDNELASASLSE